MPRKRIKRIHINMHIIKANAKNGTEEPAITIKVGKENIKCMEVTILGNSKLVYSTDNSVCKSDEPGTGVCRAPSDQKVRLHLDRKGGGKIVSIVKGLTEPPDVLNTIAKELKKGCGVGGSVKKGKILIQGNKRRTIQNILLKKGYDVKLSGG